MFDPKNLRRAQTEDVQKILFAAPEDLWTAPDEATDGVVFDLHSCFELDALCRAFPAQFRDISDAVHQQLERTVRVHSAGDYRRTEELRANKDGSASSFSLESSQLGAVYVDCLDKSFIHFSLNQLPQGGVHASLKKSAPKWGIAEEGDNLKISVRGLVSLDVVIEYSSSDKVSSEVAANLLRACLPGLETLTELGLPFDQIGTRGIISGLEVWLVNEKGQVTTCLATHRVAEIVVGPIEADRFKIPDGFRDLRSKLQKGESAWHPVGSPHRRTRRGAPVQPDRPSSGVFFQSQVIRSATQLESTLGDPFAKFEFATAPAMPECLPSTPYASSAFEIRQALLDAIQQMINLIANRMDTVTGARVDPGNTENTDVELKIDWLAQLEQFHQDQDDVGDGLFCLLRDPPAVDDPLGGGAGLLDRLAETLASQLLAADPPLPLGGEDAPIVLPPEVENEIAAIAENDSIVASQRFASLSATSQAVVREAVLAQRIATIGLVFNGNFGEMAFPTQSYDLLHVKLQLEQLELEFSNSDTVRQLQITLDNFDANRPRIEFELALGRLEATLTMERWPGLWFWVTAGGVLVVLSIVASLAVAGLILTLIGLGPLGLLILMMLLSQAPVAAAAGGALILAVVTYLVWDVTQLRLTFDQPVLRSSVSPDRASDPAEVVLDPDRVSLDGDIVVSVNSEIPSGIHQVFDAIANFAVAQCDVQVREYIEELTVDGLEGTLRRLPHFRLPQPFDIDVRVDVTGAPLDHVEIATPKHELMMVARNGVEERFLSAGALTRMAFPFPDFAPLITQVDRDQREKLTARMEQVAQEGRTPRLGYAISQNLLNGIVFSQWLSGRFVLNYDDAQADEAFTTLVSACPECADISNRHVHVWAAAAPQVFVAARAHIEEVAKPYMHIQFPDIRVCIGGVAGKASTLEIQFAVESAAHVALGGLSSGRTRTLFSLDKDFLNVLFDDRSEFRQVRPLGTQGIENSGSGFNFIDSMDETQRMQLLQDLQPLIEAAAIRMLRRNNVRQVSFLPNSPRVDQQIYDNTVLIDIQPRRASLYVVVTTFGPIAQVLASRDLNDQLVPPNLDLDGLSCLDGAALRGGI
ncbi:MAG: hypothetical protein C0453_01205 [Comamonadaceae bacterium]|nr:hypothetical protein [Comamonadaceae bacterium]